MSLFSDNDTPHRDSDLQAPKAHRRPRSKGPRVSMGSAREELQNEARRIGMLSPDGTHPTPAQQYADHHADEFDILAPLRRSVGVAERPTRGVTGSFTPVGTGSFQSVDSTSSDNSAGASSTDTVDSIGGYTIRSYSTDSYSVGSYAAQSAPDSTHSYEGLAGQSSRTDASMPMCPVNQQTYTNPADPQAPMRTAGAYSAHRNQQTQTQTHAQAHNYGNTADNSSVGATGAHHAGSSVSSSSGGNGSGNHNQGKFIPMNVGAPRPKKKKSPARALVAAGVCLVALIVVGVIGWINYDNNHAIDITLNGETVTVSGNERTLEGILDNNLVSVNPGNYVAVDASVMRAGEGNRATITVNDESVTDFTQRLRGGEKVAITDGTDITEPYTDSNEQAIPYTTEAKGVGALHIYTVKGEDGTKVTRTGNESGITVDMTSKEPVTEVIQYYNADAHGDKVVAITIDDGPWDSNTETILNILKDNDAHATFYTIGDQIASHADIVKRAHDEGNEIATHTWDHAAGSGQGVSLNLMATQERLDEVNKGNQAIQDATGAPGSKYFRAPGGNFNVEVAHDLSPLISGEIGWNIDTLDWKRPGTETIASRIKSAKPGEVILMHDGGGDRSQTVAALQEAVPYLKSQGYELITITELVERYPYQG